ncbi:MAG: hypothetical protein ABEJ78_08840 [Haloferacaceae archaeon]
MPELGTVDRKFVDEYIHPNLGTAREGDGAHVDDVEHPDSDSDPDRAAVEEPLDRVEGEQ